MEKVSRLLKIASLELEKTEGGQRYTLEATQYISLKVYYMPLGIQALAFTETTRLASPLSMDLIV